MNPRMILIGLSAVLLSVAPATAQESRFDAGLALASCSGQGMHDLVKSSLGYGVEAGFHGHLAATPIPFRLGLGVNLFPGSEEDQRKVSLTHAQLAGDIFIASGWKGLNIITGLTLNHWRVKAEAPGMDYSNSVKGLKFGCRVGLDYRISERISADLLWQVTELGTDLELKPEAVDQQALNHINPSWLQVGVKYHF